MQMQRVNAPQWININNITSKTLRTPYNVHQGCVVTATVSRSTETHTHCVACPLWKGGSWTFSSFSSRCYSLLKELWHLICLFHSKRRHQFPFSNSLRIHTVVNMTFWTGSSSYFIINFFSVSTGVFSNCWTGRPTLRRSLSCELSHLHSAPSQLTACFPCSSHILSILILNTFSVQYIHFGYHLFLLWPSELQPLPPTGLKKSLLLPSTIWTEFTFQSQCQIAEAVVQKGDNQRGIDGHLSPEC